MPIWSKKTVMIGLACLSLSVFAGCGNEKTDEEKIADAIREAAGNQIASNSDATTQAEQPTVESKLSEIRNFVTSDIWNDGFVNINSYTYRGTSATGDKLDIDFLVERLGTAMDKKTEYNTYVQGLDDSKYANVKKVWTKLSSETDVLYKQLQTDPPKANDSDYNFDTGLFEQYQDAFEKDIDDLKANS